MGTLDGVDFACVPLKIITDHEEYHDDGTLDAVGMATTLRTYKGKTSTSCPNVGDWLAAYEGADEVYAITITGTLSGSCNAAQLAAEEYQQENPGKRVFVLDSLSTGPEQVLLAEHLRDELAAGKEFDAVCEEMLRYHKKHRSMYPTFQSSRCFICKIFMCNLFEAHHSVVIPKSFSCFRFRTGLKCICLFFYTIFQWYFLLFQILNGI